jgi:predicted amidohydrolase YtcJ
MAERTRPIVAVICLVAVTAVAAYASDLATFILHSGTVLPMTAPGAVYEAIAIAEDRILAVGTDEEILLLAGSNTTIVDLAGRTVLPGFIDAHAHLLRDCGRESLSPAEAQTLALSYGVTTAAEMVVELGDLERYKAMAERGEVRVRTRLFLAYNNLCGSVLGPWYLGMTPFAEIASRLSIAGIKVFVERSSCGAKSAAISFGDELRPLLSPAGAFWYGDDRPLFSVDALAAVIREAAAAGFPVAMHAIGDAGVETALRALEQAGAPARALRPLLLHNLFVRNDLLPLYASLGATAVVEPVNTCFVDTYNDMLPASHAGIVRRWGDLAASGAHVAAGSDWPWCDAGGLNPMFRLANLVSPTNASPAYASWEPCAPLAEGQVLSVWDALRAMTIEAARALHLEANLGTLEPGKLADLVVLSGDPLTTPTSGLSEIHVLTTVIDGQIEWKEDVNPAE